jgi:hypothetical protein
MTLTSGQLLGIPAAAETAANRVTRLGASAFTASDWNLIGGTVPGFSFPTSMTVSADDASDPEITFTAVGGTGARTILPGDGEVAQAISNTGPASGTDVYTYAANGTFVTTTVDAGVGGLQQRVDLSVEIAGVG